MLGTDRLAVLVMVVDTGSFASAASRLFMTPSAVSQQVAALEREVGARLFERSRRGARPTEAGDALAAHARAVLHRLRDAQAELAALAAGHRGAVAAGSFPTATARFVARAVARFDAASPAIDVRLVDGEPSDSYLGLRARQLDVAVVFDVPGWPISRTYAGEVLGSEAEVETQALCDDPFLLALPRRHPLTAHDEVPVAALAGERFVGSSNDCAPWGDELRRICATAGFAPDLGSQFSSPDFHAIQGLVSAGLGLTFLPTLAVPTAHPDIVVRPLEGQVLRRRVKVAFPRASFRSRAVLGLVEALEATVAAEGLPAPAPEG